MKDFKHFKSLNKSEEQPKQVEELPVLATVVNCNALNLRQRPGGDVLTTIPVGTSLTVLKEIGAWTSVKLDSGESGFVRTEYIDIKR